MSDTLWLAAAAGAVLLAAAALFVLYRRHRMHALALAQRAELRMLSLRYPPLDVRDPGPVYPLVLEHVTGGEVELGSTWITVRLGPGAGVHEPLTIPWVDVLHVYSGSDDTVFVALEEGGKLALPFTSGRDVWDRIRRSRAAAPRHHPPVPVAERAPDPVSDDLASFDGDVSPTRPSRTPAAAPARPPAPSWSLAPPVAAEPGTVFPLFAAAPGRPASAGTEPIQSLVWLD
jgi:hypothetical protein